MVYLATLFGIETCTFQHKAKVFITSSCSNVFWASIDSLHHTFMFLQNLNGKIKKSIVNIGTTLMVDYKYQKCGKNQKLSITNKGPFESIGILRIEIKKNLRAFKRGRLWVGFWESDAGILEISVSLRTQITQDSTCEKSCLPLPLSSPVGCRHVSFSPTQPLLPPPPRPSHKRRH